MAGTHQTSAGGVVFKHLNSALRICLIARQNKGRKVWCLPKGHIEPNESLEETALREVQEETGLSGSILSPLGFITYHFFDSPNNKKIFKKVHFFLIRHRSGNTKNHDDEVEEVRWFPLEKALEIIEYAGEKDILKKGVRKIKPLHEQK